jgi:hypothetical protein
MRCLPYHRDDTILWLYQCEVDLVDSGVYSWIEPIESAYLHKLMDGAEIQKMLQNYIDRAMGERLKAIKAALPSFWEKRLAIRARKRQSQSSTITLSLNMYFDMTTTPSSSSHGGKYASLNKNLKRT